jgi:transcriptional regulator with XRE-family HTH domain
MPEITLTQGQRIRYAREAAGLEQEQLAELLHVSRPALSAWERDKNKRGVSFNDLQAIATHTGMPLEFFLGGDVRFAALTDSLTAREGCLAALYAMPSLFSRDDYLAAA